MLGDHGDYFPCDPHLNGHYYPKVQRYRLQITTPLSGPRQFLLPALLFLRYHQQPLTFLIKRGVVIVARPLAQVEPLLG